MGPKTEKKNVTTLSGMVVRNFFTFDVLADQTPRGGKIAKYEDFRPFWPRTAFGTCRNPGHRLKMEKGNFPAQGVPKSKKKVTTLSGMVVRKFFMLYVLPDLFDRTPMGGNSQNMGILGENGNATSRC